MRVPLKVALAGAVLGLLIFGVSAEAQQELPVTVNRECQAAFEWQPAEGPWHRSSDTSLNTQGIAGATEFTLRTRSREFLSDPWSPWRTDACTTAPAHGSRCAAQGYMESGFKLDTPCSIIEGTYFSPQNRIDDEGPLCGTWSGEGTTANPFTLGGSSDAKSGVKSGPTSCEAAPGNSCTVEVYDNAGNKTVCESPKRSLEPTGLFQCFPADQNVFAGQSVSFSAEDRTATPPYPANSVPPYVWDASSGSPDKGGGLSFTTSFATPGDYRVRVQNGSGAEAFCGVKVLKTLEPACNDPASITVRSNFPTTWTLTGPSDARETVPLRTKTYAPVLPGSYTLIPGEIPGYDVAVSPASSQTITPDKDTGKAPCGYAMAFEVAYTQRPSALLSCTPPIGEVHVNEAISFDAVGGNGSYAWTAADGTPNAGSGSRFTTTYSVAGFKTVRVSASDESAECRARVVPQCAPTLAVAPSERTIAVGEEAIYEAKYDPDGEFCDAPVEVVTEPAVWSVAPASLASLVRPGVFRGDVSGTGNVTASYRGLSDSAALNVIGPDKDFSCEVAPAAITVPQGGSVSGLVRYTALHGFTGTIGLTFSSLPAGSNLAFAPASVTLPPDPANSQYTFTAGEETPLGTHDISIIGRSGTKTRVCSLAVEVVTRPADLSVVLTADPASGYNPLTTELTATVGGSAQGPIDYHFWNDCSYTGTDLAETIRQCGAPDTFQNLSQGMKSVLRIYSPEKTYRPKVIVKRPSGASAGYVATAHATVAVNTRPDDYHFECVQNTCQRVSGIGANRCASSADCGGGPTYGACDAAAKACVNRAGSRPAGVSSCADDPACAGTSPTHLECQNKTCVIVGGPGLNAGGCTSIGGTCAEDPVETGECSLSAKPSVVHRGDASKLTWRCTNPATTCVIVGTGISGGASGSGLVRPSRSTQYILSCNRGGAAAPVSVYVLQSYDETNPGG